MTLEYLFRRAYNQSISASFQEFRAAHAEQREARRRGFVCRFKSRMRVGIVPVLDGLGGGIYQYSLSMLHALLGAQRHGECTDEFVLLTDAAVSPALAAWLNAGWTVKSFNRLSGEGWAKRSLPRLPGGDWIFEGLRWVDCKVRSWDPDRVRDRPRLRGWLKQCGIDLMVYPAPRTLAFEAGLPYVMAVHDLQHRLQPEFPEVSAHGEWERREYLFRNGVKYATIILADSEVGREDIVELYGAHGARPEKVKVLPFLPASYLTVEIPKEEISRVRKTYNLPERYLFYPAQFWSHKNHKRIVQALALLRQEYAVEIPIVLCGTHTGYIRNCTFRDVMSLVHQLGVGSQVFCLDYVPNQDISALYAGAVALVMPTFFGPTNIAPLEAWAFSCPVLSSDIRGIREQIGEAGILVDPKSTEAIAQGMYRLWTDKTLCQELATRGRKRLSSYTPADYRRRLLEILEEAKLRVLSENREAL